MDKNRSVRFLGISGVLISVLALISAGAGLFIPEIYDDAEDEGVFPEDLHPGTYSQDLMSFAAAIGLLILSIGLLMGRIETGPRLMFLGIISYFLYGYGLLAIGGTYTILYISYLAICGISLFTIIFGILSFTDFDIDSIKTKMGVEKTMGVFLIIIAVMFTLLWLTMILTTSVANDRPATYPVFIMDLCVVMPFFVITAIFLLKRFKFGKVLMGVALIKTITLILSVLIGEVIAPRYNIEPNLPMIGIYSAILIFSLIMSVSFFRSICNSNDRANTLK